MKKNLRIANNVKNNWLFICIVLFVWIIFAFSTDNPDYKTYESWYNYFRNYGYYNRFEIGFSSLYLIGLKLHFDYQSFIMIYSAIGLLLISKSVYKYSKHPAMVMILYSIYPFYFDVVQIRNFMAYAIVIFALRYLEQYSKANFVKYLVCIALATSFHVISIVYLVFLLSYIKNYKRIMRISLLVFLSFFALYFLFRNQINSIVLGLIDASYLDVGTTNFKILGYFVFGIGISVLFYAFCGSKNNSENYLMYVIPTIVILSAGVIISSQFYRLIRNMFPIIYIVFSNESFIKKEGVLRVTPNRLVLISIAFGISLYFCLKQQIWFVERIWDSNTVFN